MSGAGQRGRLPALAMGGSARLPGGPREASPRRFLPPYPVTMAGAQAQAGGAPGVWLPAEQGAVSGRVFQGRG